MKTNLFLLRISIVIFAFAFNYSCKKETSNDQTCKIVKIAVPVPGKDTAYINYSYDASDRLIKNDLGSGLYTTYSYETNKVTVKGYINNVLSYTEIYTLNSNGQAISSSYAQAGASVSRTTIYEFNVDGYLSKKTVTQASDNSKTDTYTYEYENLNLVYEDHEYSYDGPASSLKTYEYFTDKVNNFDFKLNFLGKSSANLVKKTVYTIYTDPNYVLATNYFYEFNVEGKVSKQVMTLGTGSTTFLPKYECK